MDILTAIFEQGAANISRQVTGKRCNYVLTGLGYTVKSAENGTTGRCDILAVRYNRALDCNCYTIRDIGTGKSRDVSEFEIKLGDLA